MIKSSRRAIFLFALVGFALSLAGCGEEAAQRKAFIQFLQTRIIDKPGLHIPIMSDQDITNFGPYADQYRIMNGFHHRLGASITQDLARAMRVVHHVHFAIVHEDDHAAASARNCRSSRASRKPHEIPAGAHRVDCRALSESNRLKIIPPEAPSGGMAIVEKWASFNHGAFS
jgi:Protein of unknown function (DUF3053)